ncbi:MULTISPECIES: hypothetical protein [unclassified Chryseobacterium]|uniref:hypothetical protein n=1 Tax=unclassified Chryseobacterium TaxID=2593645 RepID=UPI00100B5AC2|nr:MULTISPECIES: hypothetical protein [unclassified Chryseobacterium]RXM50580.1 hypothetical protein BOQ64_17715 [Chryseobacterium sp. CH25]RXM63216.1 hypothetical protein BOQ60_17920 [Chryseobacterium sp. CH1]
MQKNLYLIIISLSLTSCYTYQVKKQVNTAPENNLAPKKAIASTNISSSPVENAAVEFKSTNAQQPPVPINIQEKLTSNKNVKIDVDGRSYKVIVDRWEGDSLVAHPVHSAKKTLKFHKNQINGEKIAEKRFSEPMSNLLTVGIYAGIAAAIIYILR